ncbi:MAG: hypothetical protein QOC87_2142 [Actinomycetota bacterium]|nr:hypothetical protein [Actinomycetota bacterium]
MAIAATTAPPAGGAPTADLIWSGIVAILFVAILIAFAVYHRSGGSPLTRLARFGERVSGLPGWAAIPAAVAGGSLLIAVYGFYWDVATHIDTGRDPGPFANAAHYFIIVGLAGIGIAGYLALIIGADASDERAVRIRDDWRVPVGGILLFVCGMIALAGFPLDDLWHRIFGQDVTLWGPTHIQMVGGAALSTLALWVLVTEGTRARVAAAVHSKAMHLEEILLAGSFLVGLSAFQAEFDYSVPQFRLLYQPVLIAMAAATALAPARIRLGRGGALKSVACFLAIRGILTLIVGPVLGHTSLHLPLYLAEAVLVELIALWLSPKRHLAFGAACGFAIGTVGVIAEWGWSHVAMAFPWPSSLMPQALLVAAVGATCAGAMGGYIGRALSPPDAPREHVAKWIPAVVGAGILFASFFPLPIANDVRATVDATLNPVARPGAGKWVDVTVRPHPAGAIGSYDWFDVTSWQGGGSVVAPLEPNGDGSYTASAAVPVYGQWKTLVRLHEGSSIEAVPIYMPPDPAIPAPIIAAPDHFTRPFVRDKKLLLREAKTTSPWISYVAYAILGGIFLVWLIALGWGLKRMDGPAPKRGSLRRQRKPSLATS